jgi:hypothetical protein
MRVWKLIELDASLLVLSILLQDDHNLLMTFQHLGTSAVGTHLIVDKLW